MSRAIVVFSDGRRLPVSATTEAEAKRKAYLLDRAFTIVDVIPA